MLEFEPRYPRNGNNWWILTPIESGEHKGEYNFIGPFTKRDAETLNRDIGGMVMQEQPDINDSEVVNLT